MATPESLNPAPLTSLGDYTYKKVLEDDYSTGKLNLKIKGNTKLLGTANYKGWLDIDKKQSKQETKFQFPYQNYFFQIATREDGAKVHIDFGKVAKINNGNVNLFANAKFHNAEFGKAIIRFGGVTQWNTITHHLRFEYNPSAAVNLLSRISHKQNSWVFSAAEDFQITNGFGVRRIDFIAGYLSKNYDTYFRHLTNQPSKSKQFQELTNGRLLFDFIFRKNKQTFGLETEYNLEKSQFNVLAGVATKVENVDLKARVNVTQQKLALSGKGKINDRFNWTLSTEVPLNGSLPTKQGIFPLPVGFTLDASL